MGWDLYDWCVQEMCFQWCLVWAPPQEGIQNGSWPWLVREVHFLWTWVNCTRTRKCEDLTMLRNGPRQERGRQGEEPPILNSERPLLAHQKYSRKLLFYICNTKITLSLSLGKDFLTLFSSSVLFLFLFSKGKYLAIVYCRICNQYNEPCLGTTSGYCSKTVDTIFLEILP